MKAVRFDRYGGIEVLQVANVPVPEPSHGEALVKVKAASINPGEAKIREGLLHAMWPATFPSGEGSDMAGVVTKVGPGVGSFTVGDEVIGFTDRRASHAEYIVVEAKSLTIKPAKVPWEVAGSLAVAGSTAYASVRAVSLKGGDTVAISAAAGGVGSIAVQLATRAGAAVIGIASPANHEWLAAHGVKPESYGKDLVVRLRKAKIDAFIDAHGGGYETSGRARRFPIPDQHDHRLCRSARVRSEGRGRERCVKRFDARGVGCSDRVRQFGRTDRRDIPSGSGSSGLLVARARTYPRQDCAVALNGVHFCTDCGWAPACCERWRSGLR
jgi:threonine dehydrogenase-like Zn-dependent dehydrogenase